MTKRTAVIDMSEGFLGLTIERDESEDAIRVASLAPEGLAEESGLVHVGNYILSVNGKSLLGATFEEASQRIVVATSDEYLTLVLSDIAPALRQSISMPSRDVYQQQQQQQPVAEDAPAAEAEAEIERPPRKTGRRTVELAKDENGYGVKIIKKPGLPGYHIGAVTPGGAAERTELIFADDIILQVGRHACEPRLTRWQLEGIDMLATANLASLSLLAQRDRVTLLVTDPDDLAQWQAEQARAAEQQQSRNEASADDSRDEQSQQQADDDKSEYDAPLASQASAEGATRTVLLERDEKGYGLKIQATQERRGVRVTGMAEGGPADRTGRLMVGDVILAVRRVL